MFVINDMHFCSLTNAKIDCRAPSTYLQISQMLQKVQNGKKKFIWLIHWLKGILLLKHNKLSYDYGPKQERTRRIFEDKSDLYQGISINLHIP